MTDKHAPLSETAVHKMSWDGQGGSYCVTCSCGWMGFTAATTPETSITSTFDAHVDKFDNAE